MSHAPMSGAEVLAEPMRSRWSPSVFDAEHRLPDDEIARLLHAAQWAPSHGNLQPWRFLVCERGSAAHGLVVPHLTRGNSGWVPRASLLVLVATQVDDEPDRSSEAKPNDALTNLYAAGQAAAHLTLQAQATGLWTHQFKGFDRDGVAAAFAVPAHWQVVAGIAIGVRGDPAEVPERDREREQRVRSRKPLAELAYGGSWGVPWPPARLAP